MNNYKKEVQTICEQAGKQQWIYWTSEYKKIFDYPQYNMTIGDIKNDNDKQKFLDGIKDMENNKEYNELCKKARDASVRFDGLMYQYNSLSSDLIHYGIRKRHLPQFYGEMLKHMDKKLASDMASKKIEVMKHNGDFPKGKGN